MTVTTTTPLKPAHIAAQLAALRERRPHDTIVGFHCASPWTGPGRIRAGDTEFEVVSCRSALEVRAYLADRAADAAPLVLITGLDERDLGDDVLARLAKRRLLRGEPWVTVRDLFRAQLLDARLAAHAWMAEALIEAAPAGGYPPVPGGVLSLERAWGVVQESLLGLPPTPPDVDALLRWSAGPANISRLVGASRELRAAFGSWVQQSAGAVAAAVMRAIDRGHGADAIALGLVCRVVGAGAATGNVRLAQAAVRLEEYVGRDAGAEELRKWADAAEAVVNADAGARGVESVRPWLERAGRILADVGAAAEAHRSRVLPAGLEQRIEAFAAAVDASVDGRPAPTAMTEVAVALAAVRDHVLSGFDPTRAARIDMAARLGRWLGSSASAPASFAEAAAAYAREGAFVDWARTTLRGGDPSARFSASVARLLERARGRREAENEAFGRLLRGWPGAGGGAVSDLLPIETVLDRVAGPLAAEVPVLVLVVDGLSGAVFTELATDLARRNWMPLRWTVGPAMPSAAPVVAAFPTVTEVCRASLLCGRITQGSQSAEKQGFATHAKLVAASKRQFPPLLLHKGELLDPGRTDLAARVRAEIAGAGRQVIGVVLNAVDDHLLKDDQLRPRWTIETIAPLEALFQAALDGGRVVLVTGDHGHVVDMETEARAGGTSDRWRVSDGTVAAGEVELSGARVASALGDRLVAPWSERVRYCGRKNGYHGGASPQEVVVPLGVFAPPGIVPPGWEVTGLPCPEWWDAEVRPVAVVPLPPVRRPKPKPGQGSLFERDTGEAGGGARAGIEWIDSLFASPVYVAQRQVGARTAPDDERVRAVLTALHERGGTLTTTALEQKLGLPALRVRGVVMAVRRLLNVEGYDVLGLDEGTGTVTLNLELLLRQFELGGRPSTPGSQK